MSSSSTNVPSAIFSSACASFKASLSETEQEKFIEYQDAEAMLNSLETLLLNHPAQKSKLTACCARIAGVAYRLGPFFDVINIFIQSNPEYSALVWGSLRLIFMLGVNYITFLQKLSEMIDQMANILPPFEDYLKQLRERYAKKEAIAPPRLAQALAYIYADLVQFFHRACRLFSRSEKGTMSKMKLVGSLLWKPFNLYFSDVIEKFRFHTKLFRLEMRVTSDTEALKFYTVWEERMIRREEIVQEPVADIAERNTIDAGIPKLLKRLNAPAWAPPFEHARDHRTPDTGEWLLQDPIFRKYASNLQHFAAEHHRNILFIKGKPGYGKTTLATLIIDHLKTLSSDSRNPCPEYVAFYFFEKQNNSSNRSFDAFRALLSQLIHGRRHDKKVLDVAALARPEHDTGQTVASDDEIYALLHLTLLYANSCVIVCDGIDECCNRVHLLRGLFRIASDHSHVTLILISRPSIKIPLWLARKCESLDLDSTRNLEDLIRYVEPQIADLVEEGELVLSSSVTASEIARKISSKANGMFLWVTLFLEYLKLPSLTVSGRLKDIEDPTRFEGLHNLYEGIISSLQKEYPSTARISVRRALQWVSGASRPLHMDELRVALAIESNKSFDPNDTIPNFEQSLGPISGALLEVTKDKTVRLIHLSVAEYLTSSSDNASAFSDEFELNFTPAVVQHYLTSTCLSYLSYSVPAGPDVHPTSSGSEISQDIIKKYPLLKYSTQFWITHFLRFCKAINAIPKSQNSTEASERLGSLCIAFISNKMKLTSWIESSWRLHCHSEAIGLVPTAEATSIILLNETSLSQALPLVRLVCSEQNRLNSFWGHVLEHCPQEIWQPSVPVFTKSLLLERSEAAHMVSIAHQSNRSHKSIIIQAEISATGQELALIVIDPPEFKWYDRGIDYSRHNMPTGEPWDSADDCIISLTVQEEPSSNHILKAFYQIWSLDHNEIIHEQAIDVRLDTLVMLDLFDTVESSSLLSSRPFLFPTFITPTLREVFIVDTFIRIFTSQESNDLEFHGYTQKLDIAWARHNIFRTSYEASSYAPNQYEKRQNGLSNSNMETSWPAEELTEHLEVQKTLGLTSSYFCGFHKVFLGHSGEFLFIIRRSAVESLGYWNVEVFCDLNYERSPTKPNFQWINGGHLNKLYGETLPHSGNQPNWDYEINFHPQLPQIAYSELHGTYIWNILQVTEHGTHLEESRVLIYTNPLRQIKYSETGRQIHGFESIDGQDRAVIVNLHDPNRCSQTESTTTSDISQAVGSDTQDLSIYPKSQWDILEATPSIQMSQSSVLARDQNGVSTLSTLQQSNSDGSLVLHTFNESGLSRSETLLKLPRTMTRSGKITLLNPLDGPHSENVRIILGVMPRPYYSFSKSYNTEDEAFPALIERSRDSIPALEFSSGSPQYGIINSWAVQGTGHSKHAEENKRALPSVGNSDDPAHLEPSHDKASNS